MYDYPEFTGTAASILASHVRMLRNVLKGLETRDIDEYDIQDLRSIESDLVALLDKLPSDLRKCLMI